MIGASVLIVGCGPVGMTLAMDLAWRGIDVVVVETRARRERPSVKCNHVSARSMEVFRRLGVAQDLRDTCGLPHDYPNDASFRTTLVGGYELTRLAIPCRRDRFTATGGIDTWWPTPEPPHRINQIDMEPVLFDHLERMPGVRILNRTRLDRFTQDEQGVTGHCVDLESGEPVEVRARYIVGCDGGRSLVRREIGARFEGTPVLWDVQSTFIRAPELLERIEDPAWMTLCVNARRSGAVLAIDGRETWLVHNTLNPGETFDSVDRDANLRTILGVGDEFRYEIISKEDWTARRLVADRFRDRRAFICGDAAQLWVPMAGYGMNAGIASATDLSWMLAATLHGWAPPAILDAYAAERHPINEQVSQYAMSHALKHMEERRATPPAIESEGAEGEAIRARVGKALYDLNVQQFACGGLNFGYYYDRSPIIAYDGEAPPAYTMQDFTPSTVPGCRLPYFALMDGTPLYDRLGPEFTLLRLDPTADAEPLLAAARERGVPMLLLDVPAPIPEVYRHKLLISRPDRHVGWRGDAAPDDAAALIDRLRGAAAEEGALPVEASAGSA